MAPRIFFIHTVNGLVETFTKLCQELIPDAEPCHLSDDSLILAVLAAGGLTPAIYRRICSHVVVAEELRCNPFFERHDSIGWNQRLPEIASAVALAELERIEEVVEMRVLAGSCFEQVVSDCDWLVPQQTPEGYVNAYWTFSVRIMDDDLDWQAFRRKFVELGGDGFYGAYLPAHLEPIFANLNKAVEADPKRYPQWAGRLPDYRQWTCPVWESIQPRIVQLKTNYFDPDTARREADILAKTIRHFS